MPIPGQPIEIHPTFRFLVRIDGIDYAAFTECTLPSLQVETQDVKEGGQNEYIHKLPMRVKPGTVKLRHGITKGTDLLNWYMQVLQGDMKKATRTVNVGLYDSQLRAVMLWTFTNAYPVKWSGPTLKADDKSLAIEELELAHHGFEVS